MNNVLQRLINTEMGMFGVWKAYEDSTLVFECVTVEKPWEDNKPFVSCIPSGVYTFDKHDSLKHPDCYAMIGETVSHYEDAEKARYSCLIHTANLERHVVGCIGLGRKFGVLSGKWAILSSSVTVREWEALMDSSDNNTLEILNPPIM